MPSAPAVHANVAVIVRTKNRPLLLRRALSSVLSQTRADFVVVVVNDAGEPQPVEDVVAESADRADGRIHIVHNTVSQGREAAMNVGIEASTSLYVAIHDDDDTWAPTFLEATTAHLEGSEDHGVATRTEVVFEHIDGDVITVDRTEPLAADMHAITLADMIRRNYAPPISILYRRDVHDAVGLYDGSLPVLADWEFNLRFLERFTVGFIDGEPLAFWHQRPGAVGDAGNSVIAASDEHARTEGLIRDRYLRRRLAGESNVGTLLLVARLLEQERTLAEERARGVHEAMGQLLHLQRQLDQSLVSQNNRIVAQFDALNSRLDDLDSRVYAMSPRGLLGTLRGFLTRRLG